MRRQPNRNECQLGRRLDKQAPRCRSRATMGPTPKSGLQGRKTGKERLIDAKHQVTIGTWNNSVKKLNEWFKWDIISLAEVRRTGHGAVEYDGHTLLYSGNKRAHQGAVGLLLSKTASKSLLDWNPVLSRLISATNFNARFIVQKRTHTKKLDIEKLRIPEVKEHYEIEIKNRSEALSSMIEKASLDESIRYYEIGFKRYQREPWISNEVLNLANQRRTIKAKMSINPQDQDLKQKNTQLKNVINNKIEECREEWFNKQCYEAEEANKKNDMRSLFQKVKTLKKGIKLNNKSGSIRDKDGNLLTKDLDILQRWHEYGTSLYNAKIVTDESVLEQLWPNCRRNEQELDLLENEVRTAIAKIKSRKAPGIDGIEGELIKEG
ncbi:hypothetical protein ACJMK2_037187 [Sinanodonta woodiana]|uniref:Endonuclease-reverse transcriptase n=1 Tax=Sinanodonta woodiana TaxID=1069815 RepID=A0ABD3WJJ4_SINWO